MNQMIEKLTEVKSPDVIVNGKKVTFHYHPEGPKAIFDICSLEGRILVTGTIDGEKEVEVDLTLYSGNSFNLFILDGMQVHKKRFRLISSPSPQEF